MENKRKAKRKQSGSKTEANDKQKGSKQGANVNVNVNDNVNDNDNVIINNNKSNMIIKANEAEKLQTKFIECLNSYNTSAIEKCISYLEELPYEVIEKVLIKTSGIERPNWNYAKTILDDYVRKRIDSVQKIEIESNALKGDWDDD